jgi:hypothetical protein
MFRLRSIIRLNLTCICNLRGTGLEWASSALQNVLRENTKTAKERLGYGIYLVNSHHPTNHSPLFLVSHEINPRIFHIFHLMHCRYN